MWHSSAQPFIFFLFELVHLNDLHYLSFRAGPPQWPQWRRRVTSLTFDLGHISNLNGNVKEALKSSIFVVQKAAAPKTGVEFRQGSTGTIRSSLATSHDASWRRAMSPNFDQSEAEKLSQIHTHTETQTHTESTYCQALLSEQRLQKSSKVFWLDVTKPRMVPIKLQPFLPYNI